MMHKDVLLLPLLLLNEGNIHTNKLIIVTDLTSEGFLSVLKRFVTRRDLCTNIDSDHAPNFIG